MKQKKIIIIAIAVFLSVAAVIIFILSMNDNSTLNDNSSLKKIGSIVNQYMGRDTGQSVINGDKQLYQFSSAEEYGKVSRYGILPVSLRDTQIDGSMKADANGNLIIDREIRSVFDYFLSAMGEEGLDTSVGRIEEYIKLTLPEPAAQKAMAILREYLEYSKSPQGFSPTVNADIDKKAFITELKDAINERSENRRKYMDPEVVKAFFSDEETYDTFTLHSLDIEKDNSLSAAQKEKMIYQLEEQLPADTRDDRRQFRKENALNKQIDELQKTEGNEDNIYDLRAGVYGKEAADALAALDQKRAELSQRINTYREEKNKILNMPGLTNETKQFQIETLGKRMFSEEELLEANIRADTPHK